jgi:hypothetical protein
MQYLPQIIYTHKQLLDSKLAPQLFNQFIVYPTLTQQSINPAIMQLQLSTLLVLLPALSLAAPTTNSDIAIRPRQDAHPPAENIVSASDEMVHVLSGCDQGDCPDGTTVDLLKEVSNLFGNTQHYIRINDCSQCKIIPTSGDGCVNFSMCGKRQEICMDRHNDKMRMHRVNKETGKKSCYKIKQTMKQTTCGVTKISIWGKTNNVACTWG